MIFKSTFAAIDHLIPTHGKVNLVPVCAFGITHTIYNNDYTKEIGELRYAYDTNTTSMFGYDYRLIIHKPKSC